MLDYEGQIIEPPEDQDDAAEDFEELPPIDAPAPEQGGVDMDGFHQPMPDQPMPNPAHDFQMAQIMERFDRLEARLTRSEDFQTQSMAQMMALIQQNAEATARIEDKLSQLK